jgi:hypothetical protein
VPPSSILRRSSRPGRGGGQGNSAASLGIKWGLPMLPMRPPTVVFAFALIPVSPCMLGGFSFRSSYRSPDGADGHPWNLGAFAVSLAAGEHAPQLGERLPVE